MEMEICKDICIEFNYNCAEVNRRGDNECIRCNPGYVLEENMCFSCSDPKYSLCRECTNNI